MCARYRNARESWAFWWRGREALAGFSKTAQHVCRERRGIPTRANGQLAFAPYGLDSETGRYSASAIDVFTFDGPRIKEIAAFVTPEIFPAFGLPSELAA